jgi:O-antigen/teichoic acid export membrane protein
MGFWCLVFGYHATTWINYQYILLFIYEGSFFSLNFNKASLRSLYKFGVNTTLASLLDTAFNNIYQLVIGRYFSISQVGLFYQAKRTAGNTGWSYKQHYSRVLSFPPYQKCRRIKKYLFKTV